MSDYEEEEDCLSGDEGCEYGCGEFCSEPQTRDAGLCTTECATYLCAVEEEADGGTDTWICEDCGCTDSTPCIGSLGQTCHWVRKNICSACAEKRVKANEQRNTTSRA